jgi:hypothetical protein
MTIIELLVVVFLVAVLLGLLAPAVQRARASARLMQCRNQLKQLAAACLNFEASMRALPCGKEGLGSNRTRMGRSWLVPILPYVEQPELFADSETAFSSMPIPYFSPPHTPFQKSVRAYSCPEDRRSESPAYATAIGMDVGLTSYLGVCGLDFQDRSGVLLHDQQIRLSEITDGLSNTLLCGERPPSPDANFGWWYTGAGQDGSGNADMILGMSEQVANNHFNRIKHQYRCGSGPHNFQNGSLLNDCDVLHFWSLHDGGAGFALADGSVHFFSYQSGHVLKAMATRNGGEVKP